MRPYIFENAQREFVRYLRLGKSLNSPGGMNEIRKFVSSVLLDPEIRALSGQYHIGIRDLCTVTAETFARMPNHLVTDPDDNLVALNIFSETSRFEAFLKKMLPVVDGLTPHHRNLAIVRFAKLHADGLLKNLPEAQASITRTEALRASFAGLFPAIFTALFVFAIIVALFFIIF